MPINKANLVSLLATAIVLTDFILAYFYDGKATDILLGGIILLLLVRIMVR